MSNIPLTLNARNLARLLSPIIYKSINTILRDITRRPQSLPPFEEIGGIGGKKIFELKKVIDFYPPGIGAAIRRSLERESEYIENKLKNTSEQSCPPKIKTLGEELIAALGGESDEDIT